MRQGRKVKPGRMKPRAIEVVEAEVMPYDCDGVAYGAHRAILLRVGPAEAGTGLVWYPGSSYWSGTGNHYSPSSMIAICNGGPFFDVYRRLNHMRSHNPDAKEKTLCTEGRLSRLRLRAYRRRIALFLRIPLRAIDAVSIRRKHTVVVDGERR